MIEPLDAKELGDLIAEDFDNFRDEHFVNWKEIGRCALEHTAYAEMLEALKVAQASLAMMVAPDAVQRTTVMHAWASAVAAEQKAREALAKATGGQP